ncbi:MAG: SDR family NAD(P)-dependent oxidoreductase [Streptosporangiales bacterium]|nr:SDR family NAD(P)-dependent oxidoreductase [Streptosporangiales bacterium]
MSDTSPRRTVVMTGGTAGLGAHALRRMTAEPGTRVIAGVRGEGRTVPGADVLPLDLASLDSVREFAAAVTRETGDDRIDLLVLNAGLQTHPAGRRSADGYELTFAVNHLAHYLLARLLLPRIADGGRLVITTSDTHDPAIVPFGPRALDPRALARPGRGGPGSGFRAYSASKLCNLLTARSFAALEEVRARRIAVVAFNPGLTGGTSLVVRDSPVVRAATTILTHSVFRVAGRFRPAFAMGTPERAGEALAAVALGRVSPPDGRVYVSLVKGEITFPDPSDLARRDDVRDLLWRESAVMTGLPEGA